MCLSLSVFPLSCELLLGLYWIFYKIKCLAPRACIKYVLHGWLLKSNHLFVYLVSLCIQSSVPGSDFVSLLRLKLMSHVIIHMYPCNWPQSAQNLLFQVPTPSSPHLLSHAWLLKLKWCLPSLTSSTQCLKYLQLTRWHTSFCVMFVGLSSLSSFHVRKV